MVRQLLTESLVLSLAGGAVGIAFAGLGLRLLLAAMPYALPRTENIGLHLPVLLFTLLTSVLVGILFSLVPALQSARSDIQAAMRQNARGTAVGRNVVLGRLVTAQFALTLVLMTCAGLLLRSIRNLSEVNPGFDTRHVISFQVGYRLRYRILRLQRALPMNNFLPESARCPASKRQTSQILFHFLVKTTAVRSGLAARNRPPTRKPLTRFISGPDLTI
jgi:hypothetical protein